MKATAPTFDGTQPCTSVDPETFFSEMPSRPRKKDNPNYSTEIAQYSKNVVKHNMTIASAKVLCNGCQFVDLCLEYALANDVVGVWGATTERERSNIRKAKRMPTPESISIMTASWTTPNKKKKDTP